MASVCRRASSRFDNSATMIRSYGHSRGVVEFYHQPPVDRLSGLVWTLALARALSLVFALALPGL
jgi:hypothetical protein